MDPQNDFPKHDKNADIDAAAQSAFRTLIGKSEDFIIQRTDIRDHGTDYSLEVLRGDAATNVRVDVQLKGTESDAKEDGSVVIQVRRINLNYLQVQPYSIYVCYHVPSDRLLYRSTESVFREYEHSGKDWAQQATVSIKFSEALDGPALARLAGLATSNAFFHRSMRNDQVAAPVHEVPGRLQEQAPNLHVPVDRDLAHQLLQELYDADDNSTISAHFEKFAAVFGAEHAAMIPCYMAEINIGMNGLTKDEERIGTGIKVLAAALDSGLCAPSGLLYSMANGWSALGQDDIAVENYVRALNAVTAEDGDMLRAMIFKNLGSSLEKLGQSEEAVSQYTLALTHVPDLPEAHMALAHAHFRAGRYREALEHFDQVFFPNNNFRQASAANVWRITALFHLDEDAIAFRDISILTNGADRTPWVWAWTAPLVSTFGRKSVANARAALRYWDLFLTKMPDSTRAAGERLMVKIYLRANGQDTRTSYANLRKEFEAAFSALPEESLAFIWDRLGHVAQDEDNWPEAIVCFQKAYDLEGGDYEYCLGVALNADGRFEESLPLLLHQAEFQQPDAKSWFQVAHAYEGLGRVDECIEAYGKAIELDENYDLAWFNLGGVCWNAPLYDEAFRIWDIAIAKFPDHELAATLRTEPAFAKYFRDEAEEA